MLIIVVGSFFGAILQLNESLYKLLLCYFLQSPCHSPFSTLNWLTPNPWVFHSWTFLTRMSISGQAGCHLLCFYIDRGLRDGVSGRNQLQEIKMSCKVSYHSCDPSIDSKFLTLDVKQRINGYNFAEIYHLYRWTSPLSSFSCASSIGFISIFSSFVFIFR